MKTILNKTRKPLRIRLHGGKTLHLGPGKTGQISDDDAGEQNMRKLAKAGEIEIVGEARQAQSGGDEGTIHEAPRGHHPKTVVLPKGNR